MAAWDFLAGDRMGGSPVGNTGHPHLAVLPRGLVKLPVYLRVSCHLEVSSRASLLQGQPAQ